MGKLYETLAVESARKAKAEDAINKALELFDGAPHVFLEHDKELKMLDEQDKGEEGTTDYASMTTTVPYELNKVGDSFGEYLDVVIQKECANSLAKADLVVDHMRIGSDLPATFLLGLETKLKALRALIKAIPTHAGGVEWELDENFRFSSVVRLKKPEITNKTRSTLKPFILAPATKEHPAQVEKLKEDIVCGKYTNHRWSGMMNGTQKSNMLLRLDKLTEAVKIARQQANRQEIDALAIGENVISYIFGKEIRDIGTLDDDNSVVRTLMDRG